MAEYKFERATCPEEQCRGTGKFGQCPYKKVPESDYCPRHGGNKAVVKKEREALNNYRINQYKQRLAELANNPNVKSLRDEIAILRITLEEVFNSCNSPTQIIAYSGKIADLVSRIEKVVSSCNRIEMNIGLMLDKQAVTTLADGLVAIISEEIEDMDAVKRVSERITELIVKIGTHGSKSNLS